MRLIGCASLWALSACADKSTDVELRLYPCMLTSGAPTSVELTIQSIGADGNIGEPLSKTFPIEDPELVFEDNYATVAFTPPEGTQRADIAVVWKSGAEAVEATYNMPVPGLGEAMALESGECEGGPGTTSAPMTTDPSETSGPDTTDSTTSSTSEPETTGTTTTDETTSTSTTESTTGTETTVDPSETTTTTGPSTTDMTTSTTGDDPPKEGGVCGAGDVVKCSAGPGELGDLLKCVDNVWQNHNNYCQPGACPDGFTDPQPVGCVGDQGQAWSCACAETPKGTCAMGMTSGCDGGLVELCLEEGGETYYYAAACNVCDLVGGQPQCKFR